MSQQRPLGAQISHALKSRGVDVIFGIPGVHNIELYRGIEEAGIRHILPRHEQGAGFMADGYARATGKPGVAYVITGPGLCNIMTPMGQAYSDSVPMLVVSSCLDEVAAKKGQLHQMLDQEAAAATVCDWSHEARDAASAYQLIDRAFLEFSAKRPRPKHIQVSINTLGALADPSGAVSAHIGAGTGCPCPPLGDLAKDILAAKKPMFLFGRGMRGAEELARDVMRRTGAAAFTTYAGRGVLAVDEPMNFGAYLSRPDSMAVIAKADLIIAVGSSLSEVDLWRDRLGHEGRLVRVDIDPEVLVDRHRADQVFQADAAAFLGALNADLPEQTPQKWDAAAIKSSRAHWRAEVDAQHPGIVPICEALEAVLPRDTLIYSDMTQFAYVAKEVWDMTTTGLWHHPYGFGTLGYALPAAIGGKVGLPDRPVIAIAGDYGFQFTLQELGVAVELGLNLPIILWDNGKLKEIEDAMMQSQIAPNAVVAQNPDFCKLAEAYGANSARPANLAALQADVQAALQADRPTLIHVTPNLS